MPDEPLYFGDIKGANNLLLQEYHTLRHPHDQKNIIFPVKKF